MAIQSEHLHVVEDKVDALAQIWPGLERAVAVVEHEPAQGFMGEITRVTFRLPIDGHELPGAISAPLAGMIDHPTSQDVRYGIKSLTYPNGRMRKNLGYIGVSDEEMSQQQSQLVGLIEVMDHPAHDEMVPAKLHVLSPELVKLAAWSQAAEMKPSAIKELCDGAGISYDEMKVWRLKGGNRRNNTVGLADMGLDQTDFERAYIEHYYSRKSRIPGAEPVYVPAEDLPNVEWMQQPGHIELIKRLAPASADEIGDRWQVLLRREDTPRHVVFPSFAWSNRALYHQSKWIERTRRDDGAKVTHTHHHSWFESRPALVSGDDTAEYNPIDNTIEHKSTILGAILLAGCLDKDYLRHDFHLYQLGEYYKRWRQPERRQGDSAAMLALVQSDFIMSRIMSSAGFRAIRDIAGMAR